MSTGHIENALHDSTLRCEVTGSLNPQELWASLCAVGLVQPCQYGDFTNQSRDSQVEFILGAIEKKGGEAYSDFLQCLEKADEHLGHAYVTSLLKGLPFGSKTDTTLSAIFKQKLRQHMPAMMGIDTDALVPFLIQKQLLTPSETETLLNRTLTSREKINTLFSLLETKGPTAHFLFACCLQEENEHPTHQQLLCLIRSDDDDYNDGDDDDDEDSSPCVRIPQKRKALDFEDIPLPVVKVTKRDPDQVKAHGILISQCYYDKVKEIRRLHYLAQWTAADKIVDDCRQSGDKELYVAVMLRNCSGYVTRKLTDAVKNTVEKAQKMCKEIKNDNGVILRSRCEWMLAKMYRYMNDSAKAQEHIENAFFIHVQYNVQPGEDTALSNYCQACILLESVAKRWCSREADFARKCLKTATDHAILGDYGLYVSHHHIRLAQLCLHSSPHQVGACTDTNLLKEAGNALRSVDEDVLAPRTSCLFYLTKSDLYRNLKRFTEARKYAEMAHEISQRNNFKTELHSANKRFQALGIDKQRTIVGVSRSATDRTNFSTIM